MKKDASNLALQFFEVRLKNDPEQLDQLFSSGGRIQFLGESKEGSFARSCDGDAERFNLIKETVQDWRFIEVEVLDSLANEGKAVTRQRVKAMHEPSGQTITTEVTDWFRFDQDGKIVEMLEFLDTALLDQFPRG